MALYYSNGITDIRWHICSTLSYPKTILYAGNPYASRGDIELLSLLFFSSLSMNYQKIQCHPFSCRSILCSCLLYRLLAG